MVDKRIQAESHQERTGRLRNAEYHFVRVLDLSAVYKRAMSKADAPTKQTIANFGYQPSEAVSKESGCRRDYPFG